MGILKKIVIFALLVICANIYANPLKITVGDIETNTRAVPRESADGVEIIVPGDDGKLYVFKNDRTILSSDWPRTFGDEQIITSPYLSDYNNNGEKEIAVGTVDESGEYKLYLINKNCDNIAGTPVNISYEIGSDILLLDINQDNNPKWIVPDKNDRINILNFNGTLNKELILDDTDKQLFINSYDIDNDEYQDLIVTSTSGKLFVLKYNNSTGELDDFAGFPKEFSGKSFYCSSTVFLKQDGSKQIVLVSYDGDVFCVNPDNGNTEVNFSLPSGVKVISSPVIGQFDSDEDKEIAIITLKNNSYIYNIDGTLVKQLKSGYNIEKNRPKGIDFNGDNNPEILNLIKRTHLWLYLISAGQTELSSVEWGEYKHFPGIKLYDDTPYANRFFSPNGDNNKDGAELGFFRTYKEKDDHTILYTYLKIYDNENLLVKNIPLKTTDESGSGNASQVEWRGFANESYHNGDYTDIPVPQGTYHYVYHVESKDKLEMKEITGEVYLDLTAPDISCSISNPLFLNEIKAGYPDSTDIIVLIKDNYSRIKDLKIEIVDKKTQTVQRTFVITDVMLEYNETEKNWQKEISVNWNGKNQNGIYVDNDIYQVRISTEDIAGNIHNIAPEDNIVFIGTTGTTIDSKSVVCLPFIITPKEQTKNETTLHFQVIHELIDNYDETVIQNLPEDIFKIDLRVQVYGKHLKYIETSEEWVEETVDFDIVNINDFDIRQDNVTIDNLTYQEDMTFNIIWGGKDLRGQSVWPDDYALRIYITDTFENEDKANGYCIVALTQPEITSIQSEGNGYYRIYGRANRLKGFSGYEMWYKKDGNTEWQPLIVPEDRQSKTDPLYPDSNKSIRPVTGENGTLAVWDTFGLENGDYEIKLHIVGEDESTDFIKSHTINNDALIRDIQLSSDVISPNDDGIKDSTIFSFNVSQEVHNARIVVKDTSKNIIGEINLGDVSGSEYPFKKEYEFNGTVNSGEINGEFYLSLITEEVSPTDELSIMIAHNTDGSSGTVVEIDPFQVDVNGSIQGKQGYLYSWWARGNGKQFPRMQVDWDLNVFGRQDIRQYPKIPIDIVGVERYTKFDFTSSHLKYIIKAYIDDGDFWFDDSGYYTTSYLHNLNEIVNTDEAPNYLFPLKFATHEGVFWPSDFSDDVHKYSEFKQNRCSVASNYLIKNGIRYEIFNFQNSLRVKRPGRGDYIIEPKCMLILESSSVKFKNNIFATSSDIHSQGYNTFYQASQPKFIYLSKKDSVYKLYFDKFKPYFDYRENKYINILSGQKLEYDIRHLNFSYPRYFEGDSIIVNTEGMLDQPSQGTLGIELGTEERYVDLSVNFEYIDAVPWPLENENEFYSVAPNGVYSEMTWSQDNNIDMISVIQKNNPINISSIKNLDNGTETLNLPDEAYNFDPYITIKNVKILDSDNTVIADSDEKPEIKQYVLFDVNSLGNDASINISSTKEMDWETDGQITGGIGFVSMDDTTKADSISSIGYFENQTTQGYSIPDDVNFSYWDIQLQNLNDSDNQYVEIDNIDHNNHNITIKRIGDGENTKEILEVKGTINIPDFEYYTIDIGRKDLGNSGYIWWQKQKISNFGDEYKGKTLINNSTIAYLDITDLIDGEYTLLLTVKGDEVVERKIDFKKEIPIKMTNVVFSTDSFDPEQTDLKIEFDLSEDSIIEPSYCEGVIVEVLEIPEFKLQINGKIGKNVVIWDGRDHNGHYVATGDYTVRITANNYGGSTPAVHEKPITLIDETISISDVNINPNEIIPVNSIGKNKAVIFYVLSEELDDSKNEECLIEIIHNTDGVIRTLSGTGEKGTNYIIWNGFKDGGIESALPGSYNLKLQVKDNNGIIDEIEVTDAITVLNYNPGDLQSLIDISEADAEDGVVNNVIPGKNGTYFDWNVKANGWKAPRENFSANIIAEGKQYWDIRFNWTARASAIDTYYSYSSHSACADNSIVDFYINYTQTICNAYGTCIVLYAGHTYRYGNYADMYTADEWIRDLTTGRLIYSSMSWPFGGCIRYLSRSGGSRTIYSAVSGTSRLVYQGDGVWQLKNDAGQDLSNISVSWVWSPWGSVSSINFYDVELSIITPDYPQDLLSKTILNNNSFTVQRKNTPYPQDWDTTSVTWNNSATAFDDPVKELLLFNKNIDITFADENNPDRSAIFGRNNVPAYVYPDKFSVSYNNNPNVTVRFKTGQDQINVNGRDDPLLDNLTVEALSTIYEDWSSENEPELASTSGYFNGNVIMPYKEGEENTSEIDIFKNNINNNGSSYNPEGANKNNEVRISSVDIDLIKKKDENEILMSSIVDKYTVKNDGEIQILNSNDEVLQQNEELVYNNLPENDRYEKFKVVINEELERKYLVIKGDAHGTDFTEYSLEWGKGANPSQWNLINASSVSVDNAELGRWDITGLSGTYTLLLSVKDTSLNVAQAKQTFQIGNYIDGSDMFFVKSPYGKAMMALSRNALINGDEVYIKQDESSSTAIDEIVYGKYEEQDLPEGEYTGNTYDDNEISGVALERIKIGNEGGISIANKENIRNTFQINAEPTPGTSNNPEEIDSTHILINEIYLGSELFQEEGSEKFAEYIELYNPTDNVIDMSGYIIGDGEGEGKIPNGIIINAKSFFIIARDADAFFEKFNFYPALEWDPYQYDNQNNTQVPDLILFNNDRPVITMELDNKGSETISLIPQLKDDYIDKPGGEYILGDYVYDFKPDGLRFDWDIPPTLIYRGNINNLPSDIDVNTLRLAYISDKEEVEFLDTSYVNIDNDGNFTINAEVYHFSEYALAGSTLNPSPPVLNKLPKYVSDARIDISGTAEQNTVVKLYQNYSLIDERYTDNNRQFYFSDISLNEGENVFTAKAVNYVDQESEYSEKVLVIYDKTEPEIISKNIIYPLFSPDNNGIKDKCTINLNFSEPVSYNINVQDNNGSIVYQNITEDYYDTTQIELNPDIINNQGEYFISIQAYDKAGNVLNADGIEVVSDLTSPEVVFIQNRTNVSFTKENISDLIKLSFDINDSFGNNVYADIKIINSNNQDVLILTNGYVPINQKLIFYWDGKNIAGNVVPEDNYSVAVKLQDEAGNITVSTMGIINVDNTAPDGLTFVELNKTYLNNNEILEFSYDINEECYFSAFIIKDGNIINLTDNQYIIQGIYTNKLLTSFEDGQYTLNLQMKDKAGNSKNVTKMFVIDSSAPLLSINQDKINESPNELNFYGTINDTNIDKITIGYRLMDESIDDYQNLTIIKEKNFINQLIDRVDSSLFNGLYFFKVHAEDKAYNFTEQEYGPFLFEKQDTLLYLPESVYYISQSTNYFYFQLFENANVNAKFYYMQYNLLVKETEQIFEKGLNDLSLIFHKYVYDGPIIDSIFEGIIRIDIQANTTNQPENEQISESKSITVYIDRKNPVIEITEPSNFDKVDGNFDIIGTIHDTNLKKYTISLLSLKEGFLSDLYIGYNNVANNIIASLNLNDYKGEYVLRIKAEDTFGNITETDINIFIDDVEPLIEIITPEYLSYFNNDFNMTVFVQDSDLNTYNIFNKKEDTVWNSITSFQNQKYFTNILIPVSQFSSDGLYKLKVERNDSYISKETAVIIDTQEPVISFEYIDNSLEFQLNYMVNDDNPDYYNIENINNQQQIMNGSQNTINSKTLKINKDDYNGLQTFELFAIDKAGNQNKIQLDIDFSFPEVKIVLPQPESKFNHSLPVKFSVSGSVNDLTYVVYLTNNNLKYDLSSGVVQNSIYSNLFDLNTVNEGIYDLRVLLYNTSNLISEDEIKIEVDKSVLISDIILEPPYGQDDLSNNQGMFFKYTSYERLYLNTSIYKKVNNENIIDFKNNKFLPADNYYDSWDLRDKNHVLVDEDVYVFKLDAVDEVGNQIRKTKEFYIGNRNNMPDYTAPQTILTHNSDPFVWDEINQELLIVPGSVVTLSAEDILGPQDLYVSGVENTYFSTNESDFQIYNTPLYLSENKYIFKFYSSDYALNQETIHNYKVIVDGSPPICQIHNPTNFEYIKGMCDIIGTIDDHSLSQYKLELGIGNNPFDWTLLYESGHLDINTCSKDDLMTINGIGEDIADAIINARPITNFQQILDIQWIGPVRLETIKSNILLPLTDEVMKSLDSTQYQDGFYTIRLSGKDKFQYTNENKVIINIDNTSPECIITSPEDYLNATALDDITLLGTANDLNFKLYSIYIGGGENPDNWELLDTYSDPVENSILGNINLNGWWGIISLKVVVEDKAGNVSEAIVKVKRVPGVWINEVNPQGLPEDGGDWAEIYCFKKMSIDLKDFILTDLDGTDTKFADSNVTIQSDQYIVVHWGDGVDETDAVGDINNNGYIDLYVSDTTLTKTDDQLVLKANDLVVDAVIWSDYDGGMPSSEVSDANSLVNMGEWIGEFAQDNQTSAVQLEENNKGSIARIPYRDNNIKEDWLFFDIGSPGKPNDITPPITICDYNKSGEWVNHDVSIKLTAEDPIKNSFASGVDYTRFKIVSYVEPLGNIYQPTTIVKGQGLVLPSITQEGVHRICYWSADNVGNIEYTSTNYPLTISRNDLPAVVQQSTTNTIWVLIDKTQPEINISGVNNGEAYNENKTAQISISDSHLYITEIKITRYNAVKWDKTDSGTIIYHQITTNTNMELSTLSYENLFNLDGLYHIEVTTKDLADNISSTGVEFIIDKTACDIPTGLTGYVEYATNVALFWDVVSTSDFEGYNLYRNNQLIANYQQLNTNYYYDMGLEEGDYQYQVSSVDWLGNESERSSAFNLSISKDIVLFLPQPNVYYRKIAKIKAKIDTQAKKSRLIIEYSPVNEPNNWKTIKEFKHWSKWRRKLWYPWYLKEKINGHWEYMNGAYRLRVRLINEQGESQDSRVIWIDNTDPETRIADVIRITNKHKRCYSKYMNYLQGNELKVIAHDPIVNDIASGINYTYIKIYQYGQGYIVKEKKYDSLTNIYQLDDGKYKIYTYSMDNAKWYMWWQSRWGNKEYWNKDYVLVDTQVPQVSINSPLQSQVVSGNVTISGQITEDNLLRYEIYYTNEYYGKIILQSVDCKLNKKYKHKTKNYELIWDTTGLYDTTYKIVVKAYDACGNIGSQEVDVTVIGGGPQPNRTPNKPQDLLVNNLTNPYINMLLPQISWTFTDPDTGDTQSAYQVQLYTNQQILIDSGKIISTTENYSADLTGFNYQLKIINYKLKSWDNHDSESVWTEGMDYFIIDRISPAVNISGAEHNQIYEDDVNIQINVTDTYFNDQQIHVYKDNNLLADYHLQVSDYNIDLTENGAYKIVVSAHDKAGNNTTEQIEFTIDRNMEDTEPPVIVLTDLQKYNNDSVTLQYSVTDNKSDPQNIIVQGDNSPYTDEAEHTVTLKAFDEAGNWSEISFRFIIDKTSPVISYSGVSNTGVYGDNVSIDITGIDETALHDLRVKLEDIDTALTNETGKSISHLLTVSEEGEYLLLIEASDKAGNTAQTNIEFSIDRTVPLIQITGVEDDKYYNYDVTPNISITDDHPKESNIAIRHNENIIHSTGDPHLLATLTDEGKYNIQAQAEDQAGNNANKSMDFGIDKTMPQLQITGVQEGGVYSEVSPIITAFDTNLSKLDIYLNDILHVSTNVAQNTISYNLNTIKEDGDYNLKAQAQDSALNVTEEEVNFKVIPVGLTNALLFYANYNSDTPDATYSKGAPECIKGGKLTSDGQGFKGIYKALDASKMKDNTKGAEHYSEDNINMNRGSVLMWIKPAWHEPHPNGRYFFTVRKQDDSGDQNDYVMKYGVIKGRGTTVYIRDNDGHIEIYQTEEDKGGDKSKCHSYDPSAPWYEKDGWHYIGYSWDNSTGIVNLYINGKIAKSFTNVSWNPAQAGKMWIGNLQYKSSRYAKARIDEFSIYSRALSEQEIKDEYNRQRTIYVDKDYSGEEMGTSEKPYNTINEALNKADHRMIIKIRDGEYKEKLYLKKSLHLKGEEGTIVTYDHSTDYLIRTCSGLEDVILENLKIDGNNKVKYVVKIGSYNATITDCHITSGKYKNIYLYGGHEQGVVKIFRNIIEKCQEKGIYIGNKSKVEIINNTIVKNGQNPYSSWRLGIYISHSGSQTVTIMNNIIYDNGKYGIKKSKGNVDIRYNNVFNQIKNYYNCLSTEGEISSDPKFIDESNGDYHLQSSSPCINAGHPGAQYNDPDGTRNDMGRYYFQD